MGEPVLIEGYLVKSPDSVKQLHNFKKWQRKWFQLNSNGDLVYYDSEKSAKVSGVIHLLRCNRLFDAKTQGVQMSFCVGVDTGDMVVYIKAASHKSFLEWIKPMMKFADVCEIDVEDLEKRRGTIGESCRHGSVLHREQLESSERVNERTANPRHFSFTSKAKFIFKEGWLAKTGSNNKGWKNRYFRLKSGKLFYYSSDKIESNALGEIDLFVCTNVLTAAGKKGFGIDIQLPGRVYNLSAESKEECSDWYSALLSTLAQIADIKNSSAECELSGESSSEKSFSGDHRDEKCIVSSSDAGKPLKGILESSVSKDVNKDSVVMLLETEVEALREQLVNSQADLKVITGQNSQLAQELMETKNSYSMLQKELLEDKEHLQFQVSHLEKSKIELETVNDSVRIQLEEQLGRVQELEDDLLLVRQEFDESQTSNSAIEEELTETQQRLREIEAVAQQLEEALKKKGSEPPTPTMIDNQPLPTGDKEIEELNTQVVKLTEENASLAAMVEKLEQSHVQNTVTLEEAHLKWQVEMQVLRSECQKQLESEREEWEKERLQFENFVHTSEEDILLKKSDERVEDLEHKLIEMQNRIVELESQVSKSEDSLGELQIQKDKAVSDLIALRKTNRSIEKKMSDASDEPCLHSTSESSLSSDAGRPAGVSDLENKIAELSRSLTIARNERDIFEARLNQLPSTIPCFGFKTKTAASVASNSVSVTIPLDEQAAFFQENPPPKPRRPPPGQLTHFNDINESFSSPPPFETKVKARTATFIESIKTMIM